MAETKNLDDIRVWGDLESEFWLAPKGTPLPTLWGDPPEAFQPLGWLSEDGVTLALTTEVQRFRGYQGGTTLRTKVSSAEKTITAQALQDNPTTHDLYWGQGATTQVPASGTGATAVPVHTKIAIPKSPGTVERVGIAKFKDGDVTKYLLMDKLEVTEREEIPHQNAEMSAYGFTFQITGDLWLLTNAPSFRAA